jgi:hypothetical protein
MATPIMEERIPEAPLTWEIDEEGMGTTTTPVLLLAGELEGVEATPVLLLAGELEGVEATLVK